MKNERITENLVRDEFRRLGYYRQDVEIIVEEQKSQIVEVARLLSSGSKSGKGKGKGYPEFIVSTPQTPDFLLIVECKALVTKHETENHDNPRDFAVDGAIHYAAHLSKSYNVIALAVSGQRKSQLRVSVFIHPKNAPTCKPLKTKSGKKVDDILTLDDFIEHGTFDPQVAKQRHEDLMAFSRELHEFMRDHAKLTESEKPLHVSGTLLALRNKAFAKSFGDYSPSDLQKQWMHVIKEEMKKADIPHSKEYSMTQPYSSIAVHPELGKATSKYPKGVLYELVKMLNDKVWPFISVYHDFDVVGQFYGEFLKYTGGDKKALGIVLTPRHITELFALLANLGKDNKVLDICAGTGGFLISAMHQMFKKALSEAEKAYIKNHGIIGVEQQPNMYALAASNMILRGDGKANLYQGSCFDKGITTAIKSHKCDIGMLNPPYSQGDEDLHELAFVKHMLDCLEKNATGIAIVPMSCAIAPHPLRSEILKTHTLDAVMSMPDDLFYPVGVVTCIMVFRAHISHEETDQKTWFGFWKDDGFIKTKNRGRVDEFGNWPALRDSWVASYRNRDDIPGQSMKHKVSASDEWCAEAYMDTDYGALLPTDFRAAVAKHLTFKLNNEALEGLCDLSE